MNYKPNCLQSTNPDVEGPGFNHIGFAYPSIKAFSLIPPDRSVKNLVLNNTFFHRQAGHTIPGDDTLHWDDEGYGAGILDKDGSMPCSEPGATFFVNSPDMVSKDCEYRDNMNAWYCPPLPYPHRWM